jgi:hypothetical protein
MEFTLRPDNEKWMRFKIGTVFPADSILARWVAGLTMIANDLVQINIHYLDKSQEERVDNTPESLFLFYLTCSLYREAAKFLDESKHHEDIHTFIKQMPIEAQERWGNIKSSFDPWPDSFVCNDVKPVRDALFHYPSPSDSRWVEVLGDLGSHVGGVRIRGNRAADVRGVFADDLRTAMLTSHLHGQALDLAGFIQRMSLCATQLMLFAHESMAEYLNSIPREDIEFDEGMA